MWENKKRIGYRMNSIFLVWVNMKLGNRRSMTFRKKIVNLEMNIWKRFAKPYMANLELKITHNIHSSLNLHFSLTKHTNFQSNFFKETRNAQQTQNIKSTNNNTHAHNDGNNLNIWFQFWLKFTTSWYL